MLAALKDTLAVYRLTKLVLDDKLLEKPREAVWDRYPPESTYLGYLISCPWCVSFWVGGGVAFARVVAPKQWDVLATALAASAATGILYERT